MAQHDYVIDNQTSSQFRVDLNNALAAIVSQNGGDAAPTTPFANQIWYDTLNNLLKQRNEANSAWVTLGTVNEGAGKFEPNQSFATQAQAEAGTIDTVAMTPLKTKQAIAALSTSGGGSDYQVFTASGTWTKPASASANGLVVVQMWGGGASGAKTTTNNNGGGGGAYAEYYFLVSSLGATQAVTVGAGGASSTGNSNNGGASSFNSLSASGGSGIYGGGWNGGTLNSGFPANKGDMWGGGAGANGSDAASGGYFGGGGGASTSAARGTSLVGGNGGTVNTAGSIPAGGGGASTGSSGAGARGEVRIWTTW